VIFAAVDWPEAHHDVHIEDEQGRRVAGGQLADGVEGIARFHNLVAAHAEEPRDVVRPVTLPAQHVRRLSLGNADRHVIGPAEDRMRVRLHG
jgi:hypothetical protein